MKSTKERRIWNSGPPPHAGWWNCTTDTEAEPHQYHSFWRWWDGAAWSHLASYPYHTEQQCAVTASEPSSITDMVWSDYWPEGARVPRIDPKIGAEFWKGRWWQITLGGTPVPIGPPGSGALDGKAWARYAESRSAVFKGMEHLWFKPEQPVGKTRMVDGDALAQLTLDAEQLAARLRQLNNSAC